MSEFAPRQQREKRAPESASHAEATRSSSPQTTADNLAVQSLYADGVLRTKLAIGAPDDPAEAQADGMAKAAMRRSPGCGCMPRGPKCASCRRDEAIRRKPHAAAPRPARVGALSLGAGRRLGEPERRFFEARMASDFSAVRVHDDERAAQANRQLNARAFTLGDDVAFGRGEYQPHTAAGRELIAHELAHVVQQGGERVIRRQSAPTAATANTDTPAGAPQAPSADVGERENKAFDAAKVRAGQAATVLFSNPVSPSTKDEPVTEAFAIAEVVDRNAGSPVRHGFDSQGPATAYAALLGAEIGGAVLQQDAFFFACRLKKGGHKLRVLPPSVTEADWWLGRDHVYRVTPAPGVVSVTGMGGFVFPLGHDLQDDPAVTRLLTDPQMALPADADSMRRIAGAPLLGTPGTVPGQAGDEVEIAPDHQEAFIQGYFRTRGLETLAANEKEAQRLADVFKATTPGSESKEPSGVSAEAAAMIASERRQLKLYTALLEEEVKVEALLSFYAVCQERGEFPPFYPVYHKPQRELVNGMTAAMTTRQADIQRRKAGMLAASPLIGQLVGMPDPSSRFEAASRTHGNLVENLEIPRIRGTAYASANESLLAKPSTPENDNAIRARFATKLDAVRKAIRNTRSEMIGDADFLIGMEGLRALVVQDFGGVVGKNAKLNDKLKEMLHEHAVTEKHWQEAEIVIQVGLLFIPGAGPFLSAIAGYGFSVASMSSSLRRWTASQASVNPAAALVNQQTAEAQLTQSTIDLTVNAVFAATEAISALKSLGTTAGEKRVGDAIKSIEENEAGHINARGATLSGRDELVVSAAGIGRCSPACPLLRVEFAKELEKDVAAGGALEKELSAAEALRNTDPEAAYQAGRRIEQKLMELREPAAARIKSIQELPANVQAALTDRPDALKIVTSSPAALGLVARHGEAAVRVLEVFPHDGVELLQKYERIQHLEGADKILKRLGDIRQQAQGARGELLRIEELYSQGVGIERVNDAIKGKEAADIVLTGNVIEDTKDFTGRDWDKYPDFLVNIDIRNMTEQVALRRAQYPGATIRYVFYGPVHPRIIEALQKADVKVIAPQMGIF